MMRKAWWLIAAATVTGAAWALDPPRPAPSPPTSQPGTGEQPVPVTAPAAVPATQEAAEPPAEAEAAPPPAPETRRTGPTPQRFDPTEEVRADFPVSFPSDI
jgi:hypothetical protein